MNHAVAYWSAVMVTLVVLVLVSSFMAGLGWFIGRECFEFYFGAIA